MANEPLESINRALSGHTDLLMKKKILAVGKNYAVMDQEQNHLCYVYLDAKQNLVGNLLSGALGSWAGREMGYTYIVQDQNNQNALIIKKGAGAWKASFGVFDAESGDQKGMISMKRGLIGGMQAEWIDKETDQVTMQTRGNVLKRQYKILGPNGEELGHVRHKIAAVRDVWNLRLSDDANILNAAIFATVLDFEKEM